MRLKERIRYPYEVKSLTHVVHSFAFATDGWWTSCRLFVSLNPGDYRTYGVQINEVANCLQCLGADWR